MISTNMSTQAERAIFEEQMNQAYIISQAEAEINAAHQANLANKMRIHQDAGTVRILSHEKDYVVEEHQENMRIAEMKNNTAEHCNIMIQRQREELERENQRRTREFELKVQAEFSKIAHESRLRTEAAATEARSQSLNNIDELSQIRLQHETEKHTMNTQYQH